MFIICPDLAGNLNYPDLEGRIHQVAAKGTWLKLNGFGDAGHQLRKLCPPSHPFHHVAH